MKNGVPFAVNLEKGQVVMTTFINLSLMLGLMSLIAWLFAYAIPALTFLPAIALVFAFIALVWLTDVVVSPGASS